jgi:hypothetical protein
LYRGPVLTEKLGDFAARLTLRSPAAIRAADGGSGTPRYAQSPAESRFALSRHPRFEAIGIRVTSFAQVLDSTAEHFYRPGIGINAEDSSKNASNNA